MKFKAFFILFTAVFQFLSARPVIMLTGYWAPTSEMIARFSTDPVLNPEGWIGENWENYGYDIQAFFPAFDVNTREFEVDYQATWNDFWLRVDEYNPEIIISFGAGDGPWEIEYRARNLFDWDPDDLEPFLPTPNPPDSTVPIDFERFSTLPLEEIRSAVNEQTTLNAWVDYNGDAGAFLCEYIAYLGMWYQNIHNSIDDENYCRASGFIHLHEDTDVLEAFETVKVTLRTTIEYFENLLDVNGLVSMDGELTDLCIIKLTDQFQRIFETETDEIGNFTFDELSPGEYQILATSGRYYYYEGSVLIDSINTFIELELDEYEPLSPLTYCNSPDILESGDSGPVITIGSYFPQEILESYSECHLNSFGVTAPLDSDNCMLFLKLYSGNPLSNTFLQELFSSQLNNFDQGDYITYDISNIFQLNDEILENGLTVSCVLINSDGNYGWMDNGSADPNGNLIKVGAQWHHADEYIGFMGNWDLRLDFFGTEEVSKEDKLLSHCNLKLQNYPNPFNPSTTISFSIPRKDPPNCMLSIYNLKGQLIRKFKIRKPEQNSIIWNGRDQNDKQVTSGVYLYKLKSGNNQVSNKMLLLK